MIHTTYTFHRDQGAYILFDPTQAYRYKSKAPIKLPSNDDVTSCLVSAASSGSTNSACLDLFLFEAGLTYDQYWAYLYEPPQHTNPESVDACLTFSGPASQGLPLFQNCVGDETSELCTLAGHAWSPTSSNNVPVGQTHVVIYDGTEAQGLVQNLYAQAKSIVLAAVDDALANWYDLFYPVLNMF